MEIDHMKIQSSLSNFTSKSAFLHLCFSLMSVISSKFVLLVLVTFAILMSCRIYRHFRPWSSCFPYSQYSSSALQYFLFGLPESVVNSRRFWTLIASTVESLWCHLSWDGTLLVDWPLNFLRGATWEIKYGTWYTKQCM